VTDIAIDGPGLLRSVGLMADGPAVWGRPMRAAGPGVFVVELPSPPATAPIELTRIGKWVERLPGMRIDGREATSRAVAARLADFWIPSTTVLFIGSSASSVASRVAAIERTPLGDRRPYGSAGWLRTISSLERARVWWAATTALEEYEDALFAAFAAAIPAEDRERLHDASVVLPWANLRSTSGERKAHGLTGYLVAEEPVVKLPPTHVVDMPPGDAEGTTGVRPTRAAGGTVRRTNRPPAGERAARPAPSVAHRGAKAANARAARAEPVYLSAEGVARLREELAELTGTRRPDVIARIKSAKELGDLKENADYTSAREEQSFLEGRIATIEGLLRNAIVIQPQRGGTTGRIDVGSRVTIEAADAPGDSIVYELVGSAEADPAAGRISNASPVGRALLGRTAGETVAVTTPRGQVEYRIVAVE
jgi:transcription elongation factor GreA